MNKRSRSSERPVDGFETPQEQASRPNEERGAGQGPTPATRRRIVVEEETLEEEERTVLRQEVSVESTFSLHRGSPPNAATQDGEEEEGTSAQDTDHLQRERFAQARSAVRRSLFDEEAVGSGDERDHEEDDDMMEEESEANSFVVPDGESLSPDHFAGHVESEEDGERASQLAAKYENDERAREYEVDEEEEEGEEQHWHERDGEGQDEGLSENANTVRNVFTRVSAEILEILEAEATQSAAEVEQHVLRAEGAGPSEANAFNDPNDVYGGFTRDFAFGFSNNLDHRTAVINDGSSKAYNIKKAREQAQEAGGEPAPVDDDGELDLAYTLNPSSIAEFFSSNHCKASLVIKTLVRATTNSKTYRFVSGGILSSVREHDLFSAKVYVERELGKRYEREVVDKLKLKQYRVYEGDNDWESDDEETQSSEEGAAEDVENCRTVKILLKLLNRCKDDSYHGVVEYIYQARLALNLQAAGLVGETEGCRIMGPTVFEPDLLEMEFRRHPDGQPGCKLFLRLVEIKASQHVMPKHRVQLGLYSIMMSQWLSSDPALAGKRHLVELDVKEAGVWLLDARWYERTGIETLQNDLQTFLRRRLVSILERPQQAKKCGQCHVCALLARAMRKTHGQNLVGLGTEARLSELPLTGLLNGYDVSLLHELQGHAWPSAAVDDPPPSVRQLVNVLPRVCNLYLTGLFNDPLDPEIDISGVEVDGDPGWTFRTCEIPGNLQGDALDEAVRPHLPDDGEPHAVLVVIVQQTKRVAGVTDAAGRWMAFKCIHEDYVLLSGHWLADPNALRATVKELDVQERTITFEVVALPDSHSQEETQMSVDDFETEAKVTRDDRLTKALTRPPEFVQLITPAAECVFASVQRTDVAASTITLGLAPGTPEVRLAEVVIGATYHLITQMRAQFSAQLRSIAVTEMQSELDDGGTSITVAAAPWTLDAAGPHELEVMHKGAPLRLQCARWEQSTLTFTLEEPYDGDSIPPRSVVKVVEPQPRGLTRQVTIMGNVQLNRSRGGVLRVYLIQDEAEGGYLPFLTRKIILRRKGCELLEELWQLWGATAAGEAEEIGGLVDSDASKRVVSKLLAQGGHAAVLNAAMLGVRVRSMLDQELRLINEADISFPQAQPNVEIVLSGISNRFLALRKENYMVCCSINVRVQYGKDRELRLYERFSSLDCEGWNSDGRFADRFLIITLYKLCKAVEELNTELKAWEDQLSVQVYTYDAEFSRAVTQMLSDVFCCAGGLAGPHDRDEQAHWGPEDGSEGPSLWRMAQYLCVFLTSHVNGILATEEMAEAQKQSTFTRTTTLVPLVGVLKTIFAVPSLGERPLAVDAVAEVFGHDPGDRENARRCNIDQLLEHRIERGDWRQLARVRQDTEIIEVPRMKLFDNRLKGRERRVWRIVDSMRRALRFMQDGVALNHAVKCPVAHVRFEGPTLSRLAFMVHQEVELSLQEKEAARKQHVVRQEALDQATRLRLICSYWPPHCGSFAEKSQDDRRAVISTHFAMKPLKLQRLYAHVFGTGSHRRLTPEQMVDGLVTNYEQRQGSEVEDFVWVYGGKSTRYHDIIGCVPLFIFKLTGDHKSCEHYREKQFLLVEASVDGRRTVTMYKDNVMSFQTLVPSSFKPDGSAHMSCRRIAVCRPSAVPAHFASLCVALGEDPDCFVAVVTNDDFKTKNPAAKPRGADGQVLAESGWSLVRDRCTLLTLDRRVLTDDEAQARLTKFSARSRADYLLFEPCPGFALKHQTDHLRALGNLEVDLRVLLKIMRDPITYNADNTPSALRLAGYGSLTTSQRAAANLILGQVCTIVRGPPGTGKTEFISTFVLNMQRPPGSVGAGTALVVGVTAYQRSGVRTLVNRMARYPSEHVCIMVVASSMDRWEQWDLVDGVLRYTPADLRKADFASFYKKQLESKRVLVIGGTVWQLFNLSKVVAKIDRNDNSGNQLQLAFDLIVVDEASQMPVVAASCVTQFVERAPGRHGRLVFVGDEHQLPPVIKGDYVERSLVFDRYWANYAAYLPSCGDYLYAGHGRAIPADSVCVGCSAFNRRLVLRLLEPWLPGQDGPRVQVLHQGDGLHAHTLKELVNQQFASFRDLRLACRPVLDKIVGEDAGHHFYRRLHHELEHLPIERSIFENLRVSDQLSQWMGGRSCFTQLQETWRMNTLLSKVFRPIYQADGVDVRFEPVPAHLGGNADMILDVDMVRVQAFLAKLRLSDRLTELMRAMVDPTNCLVVVVLKDVPDYQMTHPQQDGPESLIATLFMEALRSGKPDTEEVAQAFGTKFCFVNTPMHRQRRAVTRSLEKRVAGVIGWNVATVDKMQGQQSDCVVSLYGYSDFQIESSPNFVYSRNRINVALSRAKAKAVLIVSEQMLTVRPSILHDHPGVELGYAMFRHVHDFSREQGNAEPGQRPYFGEITPTEVAAIKLCYEARGL